MHISLHSLTPRFVLALSIASLLASHSALASTLTWNGTAGANWDTTATNWLDGSTPASWNSGTPDDAVFGSTGAGTINLASGGITAGSLTFNAANYTIATNTLTLSGSPTITTNADAAISSTLAGTAGFVKSGSSTLTLSGNNSGLSGGVTISGGILQLNNANSAGTGTITLGDANTLTAATQLTLGSGIDAGFTRDITVSSLGTGTATIKVADVGTGTSGTSTITLNRAATIDGSAITNGYYQSNRSLAGAGTLTYAGAAGKRFILGTDSPTFTGDIIVQTGVFEPRDKLKAANGNNVTIKSGAELRIQFVDTSINALNGEVGSLVNNTQPIQTLTIGKGNGSGNFAGVIQSALNITKTGNGTQTLSGTNTYSGTTTVNAGSLIVSSGINSSSGLTINGGTLQLGAANMLKDTGPVTLAGGTLATGGFSDTVGTLSLTLDSVIDLGAGTSVFHFATSSTAWATGKLLTILNWTGNVAGGGTDQIYFGSSAAGLGTNLAAIRFQDPAGFASGTYSAQMLPTGELVVVPEPSAWMSLLGGFGVLLGLRRRRASF